MELFLTGVSYQEEADDLASVAHLLRDANLTFKFSTSQPFPLHLLNSLEKYWKANLKSDERIIQERERERTLVVILPTRV